MTKKETHYKIAKIVKVYERRIIHCNEQWIVLNDSNDINENLGDEMNSLISEMDLMNEFIDDLKELTSEEE